MTITSAPQAMSLQANPSPMAGLIGKEVSSSFWAGSLSVAHGCLAPRTLFLSTMTCYLVVSNKPQHMTTVRFTPGQLRDAAAVPPETYRHWKKVLTPLRRNTRQSPCFTAGDLLAVAIVRTMTGFSVRVGSISEIAEELFRLCNDTSWPILERSRMIIDLVNKRLELRPESEDIGLNSPAIVCPLRPLVDQLRAALLTDGGPEQQRLYLPPVPLPSKTEGNQQAVARECR